jgi:uncharacterized protein YjbJ (UPF0337 family)
MKRHFVTRKHPSLRTFVKQNTNHNNTKHMKNTLELKSDWNLIKGKLKQKFAALTDNDLLLLEGKQDEMLSRIQAKLGKSKTEIQKLISEL